ncbi:MAG TPA: YicC family protein [Candidatus Omnitrophica bacterium]|nr:YicC family protein [Candidatus Omnitrophota bacterium]
MYNKVTIEVFKKEIAVLRSMTGYGLAEVKASFGIIKIEIKSLNHRYLEITTRIPEGFQVFEERIESFIRHKIKRGRVNLFLNIEGGNDSDIQIKINKGLVSKYLNLLKELKKEFKLGGEISLDRILDFPEVVEYKRKRYDLPCCWPDVRRATNKALLDLIKSRKKEGRIIQAELSKRIEVIKELLKKIKKRLPVVLKDKKTQFLKHLKESGIKNLNSEKFNLDLAAYLRNFDISEEITRLDAHLKDFKHSLRLNSEVGRRLDFIAQELNREANTVSSKTQDYQISKAVIEIKAEIEKIREQVQNVE